MKHLDRHFIQQHLGQTFQFQARLQRASHQIKNTHYFRICVQDVLTKSSDGNYEYVADHAWLDVPERVLLQCRVNFVLRFGAQCETYFKQETIQCYGLKFLHGHVVNQNHLETTLSYYKRVLRLFQDLPMTEELQIRIDRCTRIEEALKLKLSKLKERKS